MSFFDHVRCPSCGAILDPESIIPGPGQGPTCPKCKSALSLTDLFGVADAFRDEDDPELSLDDLVPDGPARPSRPATANPAKSVFDDDGDSGPPRMIAERPKGPGRR